MRRVSRLMGPVQPPSTKNLHPEFWSDLSRLGDDPKPVHLSEAAGYYNTTIGTLSGFPYRLAGNNFLSELRRATGEKFKFLKRNVLIVPAKDGNGAICGLSTWRDVWISSPCLHVRNHQQAHLGIHLVGTIIEADLLAESVRHCVVALGGLREETLWDLFPHLREIVILSRPQAEVAA